MHNSVKVIAYFSGEIICRFGQFFGSIFTFLATDSSISVKRNANSSSKLPIFLHKKQLYIVSFEGK